MNHSGNPRQSASAPGISCDAILAIDYTSGEILDCNDAAVSLLAVTREQLLGAPWEQALSCDASSLAVLAHAVVSRTHVYLPPFILRRADASEAAVAGVVLPAGTGQPENFSLLLWQVLGEAQLDLCADLSAADTLAVLGVDHQHLDEHWDARQTEHFMTGVRRSLLEIVRANDAIGMPTGAALGVVLRDVETEGARDICRALLSHLHGVHGRADSDSAVGIRFCVGLARPEAGTSALTTLLQANSALLQAQSSTSDPIRVASREDLSLIAGRAAYGAGVFTEQSPAQMRDSPTQELAPRMPESPPVVPIEANIEGYVVDNMEGAVDQAIFLARLDIPVAIIGPAGTGKMYVAKIIHEEWGGTPGGLVALDCRDFRQRSQANARIASELAGGEGKTLVFKSPHLMPAEVQIKLARQISSRTRADVSPARYLPRLKLIALFPDTLEHLIRKGELTQQLASAFAGYPINVPPIRDRAQAVLRWAHKILGQEAVTRDRAMKGFTPDAQRAMLLYEWPGNISEMRRCIVTALDKTDKDWLTPVDLGMFKGIEPQGTPAAVESKAFLQSIVQAETRSEAEDAYVPSALEALDVALGEAVHTALSLELIKPLGSWLEDELVLASLDRYRNDVPRTARFLHTRPRNISRWLLPIQEREGERIGSSLWQKPRRLLWEWVRESPQPPASPLMQLGEILMVHVSTQAAQLSSTRRAQMMGVSTPTYLKRLREIEGR